MVRESRNPQGWKKNVHRYIMSWKAELGYEPNNTVDTLKKKYLRLALQRHPNKGGTTANFQRLQAAWENAQKALSGNRNNSSRGPPSRATNYDIRIVVNGITDVGTVVGSVKSTMTVQELFETISSMRARIEQLPYGGTVQTGFKVWLVKSDITYINVIPSNRQIEKFDYFPINEIQVLLRRPGQKKNGWYFPPSAPKPRGPPRTAANEGFVRPVRFGVPSIKIPLPERLTVQRVYDIVSDWLNISFPFAIVLNRKTRAGTIITVLGPAKMLREDRNTYGRTTYKTKGLKSVVDTAKWGKGEAGMLYITADFPDRYAREVTKTKDGETLTTSSFSIMALWDIDLMYDPIKKRFVNFKQNAAATKIQAAWKGKKARNLAEHLRYMPGGTGFNKARANWSQRGGGTAANNVRPNRQPTPNRTNRQPTPNRANRQPTPTRTNRQPTPNRRPTPNRTNRANSYAARARAALSELARQGIKVMPVTRQRLTELANGAAPSEKDKQSIRAQERRVGKGRGR